MPTQTLVDKLRSGTSRVFVWQGDEVTKPIFNGRCVVVV